MNGTDIRQTSDEELARNAQAGSSDAFDRLVERHLPPVYRFLRARTGHAQDAEDLAQQTFVTAFRKLHRYNPARPFRPWLYTIARRAAASFYRARRAAEDRTADVTAGGTDARDPARILAERDGAAALWAWSRGVLPERSFAALWLHIGEDLDIEETARALGLARTHVRVLLHRARHTLAAAYDRQHPDAAPHAAAGLGNGALKGVKTP